MKERAEYWWCVRDDGKAAAESRGASRDGLKAWQLREKGFEVFLKQNRAKYERTGRKWRAIRTACRQDFKELSADRVGELIEEYFSGPVVNESEAAIAVAQVTERIKKKQMPKLTMKQKSELVDN